MRLNTSNIAIIKRLLVGKASRPLRGILTKCEPAEIATLFSIYPAKENLQLVIALIATGQASEVLQEVPEPQLVKLLLGLDSKNLKLLLEEFPEDECAYFLGLLSEEEQEKIFEFLDKARALRLKQILAYPEDSAGRIMNTNIFSLPEHLNAKEGISFLRQKTRDLSFYYAYLTTSENKLIGVVSLREMATAPETTPLAEIAKKEIISVTPLTSTEDVSNIVDRYNFLAIPVVDEENIILGIIEIDDIIDIIQEQATADIYAGAGLQEDDRIYSPALFSIKHRLPWMLLNLGLAAWISHVVSFFEGTMQELILLATLKNIVAGLGGNTAIQSLTVVTRGIALDDFSFTSRTKTIIKEACVGAFNGLLIGFIAGILIYVWKQHVMVSIVIFISIVIICTLAAILGASIPIILKNFNKDPAAGSGVLVTTLTDAAGFFTFLGIASLGLIYFKDYL